MNELALALPMCIMGVGSALLGAFIGLVAHWEFYHDDDSEEVQGRE